MTQSQSLGDHAAQRAADHVSALDPQRVEDGTGVVGHVGHAESAVGEIAAPRAAVVDGDAAVPGGEVAEQRSPGADGRAQAHASQQNAIPDGGRTQFSAGDHRQERPERAGAQHEESGADQNGRERRSVSRVAQPRAGGAEQALGRQDGARRGRPAPTIDHREHSQERQRVQREHERGAAGGHDEPSERRSDRAPDVDGQGVQRDGAREVRLRYHLRRERLPARRVHGRAETESEGQREKERRSHEPGERQHGEHARDDQHPALRPQQKPSAIEDVSRCSGEKTDEEHR